MRFQTMVLARKENLEKSRKNMRKAIHFVDGTWRASIGFQGKVYNLGTFTAFYEAVQVRVKAEKELYDPLIRRFQAQKKKTSGNEIPSCTVGAEKQMEEVLAE